MHQKSDWFCNFQSFNQNFQHSFWSFNQIFNQKNLKSIENWSKMVKKNIKNWSILIGFWHNPFIGIQFYRWILKQADFVIPSCWNSNLNNWSFNLEGLTSIPFWKRPRIWQTKIIFLKKQTKKQTSRIKPLKINLML